MTNNHCDAFRPADNDVDIVMELRLRRWARENYVPPADRRANWHCVVLDEMRLKDAEMIIGTRAREPVPSYVPLAPMPITRIHPRHAIPNAPHVGARSLSQNETDVAGIPQRARASRLSASAR